MKSRLLFLITLLLLPEISLGVDWVRPGINTNQPVWGVRGGLLWAVSPGGFGERGGPRGLIRLGYPILTNGEYALVNFIAVEPIVRGQRGLSELEHSKLDDKQGKRFWAVDEKDAKQNEKPRGNSLLTPALSSARSEGEGEELVAGQISKLPSGAEQLEVVVRVEPFENGANVRLVISQRSDAPDEITLRIHAEPDSAPMEFCILTATMGNMARVRQLWLADEMVSSLKLYPDHKGNGFAPHTFYPLERLARNETGDVLAAITTNEKDPAKVFPFPGSTRWHYGGFPVTQYWKKSRDTFRDDLRVVVNARSTYWGNHRPIPGGVAFENFEMQEKFYDGQKFIFGITRKTPKELGFDEK